MDQLIILVGPYPTHFTTISSGILLLNHLSLSKSLHAVLRLFVLVVCLSGWANRSSADEKTKVACVGDSITFGAAIKDRVRNCYPTQLGNLLGDSFEVRNFGRNGATLLREGDLPYFKQTQFKQAMEFQPDVVVIKLGTNDTKPQNWGKFSSDYRKDYVWLIEQFKKLPSKPRIYVCLPVPVAKDRWGIRESVVSEEVIPMVKEVSRITKTSVIDLYTPFEGKHNLIPDGVHPNGAGAKIIAQAVKQAISKKK